MKFFNRGFILKQYKTKIWKPERKNFHADYLLKKLSRRLFIKDTAKWTALGIATVSLPGIFSCGKSRDITLDEFMQLSSLLTGFEVSDLDKSSGQTYLNSLKNFPPSGSSISSLYDKFKLNLNTPVNLNYNVVDDLTLDADKKLAQRIVMYWYKGDYKDGNEYKMLNFNQNLGWQATVYGSPEASNRLRKSGVRMSRRYELLAQSTKYIKKLSYAK